MAQANSYYNTLNPERRSRLQAIRAMIQQDFPEAEESMRNQMPTFELAGNWIAMASQKNYVSVYTCCCDHLAEYRAKHPQIKGGKGCLNFKDNDELHETDLRQVIAKALTAYKGKLVT